MTEPRTVSFVLYPGITLLDLVGPLQVFAALREMTPEFRVVVVADRLEPMPTDTPLTVTADHTFDQAPDPHVLVVPGGGEPTLRAMHDERLLAYLRRAAAGAEIVASVCTGSLLLGAAGLLTGRRAATHWSFRHLLPVFDAVPVAERWVVDGPVTTAAGISAGIDLALHLVDRLAGTEAALGVQFALEYDPQPPLGALSWDTAPHDLFAPMTEKWVREAWASRPDWLERMTHLS